MTLLAAALAAVVAVLVIVSGQAAARARRLRDRLDALAVANGGGTLVASPSPDLALDRLERTLARRASVPPTMHQIEADRYRSALASITLGVVLVDEHGSVRYRNPFAASFLEGRHGAAVVGQVIDDLARAALDGAGGEREVQIYGPPRRKLFVSASPIVEDARFLGAVVMIDDITEQERIDAIRRDFVANISHELRTPIGAMSLLAETLVDETDSEVIATLARRIESEAGRLGSTIEDLLELSRIEHGSDEHFVEVALRGVITTAVDRVRAAADQAGVEIGVTLPARDLHVRGDERQLASALYNLLDNAVKYIGDDGGTVSVRARVVDDQVEIAVQDSGIGVPRKDLDRVFERFYRVDQARSRDSGGTGLGLAIVRHVVANHGGRIAVDSTEGEGTTFTMQLPSFSPSDSTAAGGLGKPGRPSAEGPNSR
jgi:two-component system, OmpR family, sensor histidine kinase SenX3